MRKLLRYLRVNWLEKVQADAARVRLDVLLAEYERQGILTRPEGLDFNR